jgi:hypothetical protein
VRGAARRGRILHVDLPPVTPELILFVLVGPPLASIAVALGGLFARRRGVPGALFFFFVGLAWFIASLLWILLVVRIEAIEQRSLEETLPL